MYLDDTSEFSCTFSPFSFTETCDDSVKFLYAIDEDYGDNTDSDSHIFTIDPSTNTLLMQVLDSTTAAGSYTFKLRGTTQSGQDESEEFTLTLQSGTAPAGYNPVCDGASCAASSDTVTVMASPPPTDVTHVLNSGTDLTTTIAEFSENTSSVCDETDIVYSMAVTPNTSGQDTTFI